MNKTSVENSCLLHFHTVKYTNCLITELTPSLFSEGEYLLIRKGAQEK